MSTNKGQPLANRHPRWREALDMFIAGQPLSACANLIGVKNSTIYHYWAVAGKPKRAGGRVQWKPDADLADRSLALYLAGVSAKEVARQTGITRFTLVRLWNRAGRPKRLREVQRSGRPPKYTGTAKQVAFLVRHDNGNGEHIADLSRDMGIPESTLSWWKVRARARRIAATAPSTPDALTDTPYIPFTRPGKVFRFRPLPESMWRKVQMSPVDDLRAGVSSEEMRTTLLAILAEEELSPDQKLDVAAFLGAEYGIRWRLDDVGKLLGVCRERARQLEDRAVQKLGYDFARREFDEPTHQETYAEYAEAISAT
jgi:transposase-like protein